MSAPELAVTWSRRLHYSIDLAPADRGLPGREGHAVCNGNYWVYDSEAFHRFGHPGHYKPVDFAELPLCKRCAKRGES